MDTKPDSNGVNTPGVHNPPRGHGEPILYLV